MDALRSVAAGVDSSLSDRRPWQLVAGTTAATLAAVWTCQQLLYHDEGVSKRVKKALFRLVRRVPSVKQKIESKRLETYTGMCDQMHAEDGGLPYLTELPAHGLSPEEVLDEVNKYTALGKYSHMNGQLSGTVYHGSPQLTQLMTNVYAKAAWSNPLHPNVFPGVRKMEAEIVAMCCRLFHGGPDACGSMTSGGTESIVMAMKACRDMAREQRDVTLPEVLVPFSAHAAFDKGGDFLRMRVIHVPLDPVTSRVDVSAMRSRITSNTVMLVCSAPGFPHGSIDPVEEVAALGLEFNIPVHVDACLGGFLVAFMEEAGYHVPGFDFNVPGVTSLSADTHKYGFAPKGSSVVLYSSRQMQHFQYFVQPDWPGGIYGSPSLAGSRSGAIIAGCWAAMRHFGRDGYVNSTRLIIETTRYLETQFADIEGLHVQGSCDVSVVALGSDHFNIYRLSDEMDGRGWSLNSLQSPPGVHIAVTFCHTQPGVKERLVDDVRCATAQILSSPRSQDDQSATAALYGMSATIPDRSLVSEMAWCYLDSTYHVR